MKGLYKLLYEETGLPVSLADDPLTAIVLGTGIVLDEIKFWWQQLGQAMEGRQVGGSPMFLAVRDEEGNLPLGTTNMAKAFNSLTSKGNAPQP